MDGTSREGGLDGTRNRDDRTGERRLANPIIGVIGKSVLTNKEKDTLFFIGRCIARLGHTLACIPAKGTADAVREGVKAEGGGLLELEANVIGTANMTWIYPDRRLLSRLLTAYPNLQAQDNAVVIREDQLDEWRAAVETVLADKDIATPQ